MSSATALTEASPRTSLVTRFAARFGVDPNKLLTMLKATAFRADREITNEEMMSLLVVADQYRLNPFTAELWAFPRKGGGIVPIVSVDGWARIMNEDEHFDGIEFTDGPDDEHGWPEWIECTIYRKDRGHPTKVRERMRECRRANTIPWQSHPARMLRHKSMIQCARVAFGFAGIYDEDEGRRIIEAEVQGERVVESSTSAVKQRLKAMRPAEAMPDSSEAVPENPNASAAPASEISPSRESPAPTYAELREQIERAATGADFQLIDDLIRSSRADLGDALADELDERKQARLKELAAQRAKK